MTQRLTKIKYRSQLPIFHGPVVFALYHEDYLMDDHHIMIMSQCDPTFDL